MNGLARVNSYAAKDLTDVKDINMNEQGPSIRINSQQLANSMKATGVKHKLIEPRVQEVHAVGSQQNLLNASVPSVMMSGLAPGLVHQIPPAPRNTEGRK